MCQGPETEKSTVAGECEEKETKLPAWGGGTVFIPEARSGSNGFLNFSGILSYFYSFYYFLYLWDGLLQVCVTWIIRNNAIFRKRKGVLYAHHSILFLLALCFSRLTELMKVISLSGWPQVLAWAWPDAGHPGTCHPNVPSHRDTNINHLRTLAQEHSSMFSSPTTWVWALQWEYLII